LNELRKYATGLRLCLVAALAGGLVTAFGGTAQAAVSNCDVGRSAAGNQAWAGCLKGFGSYRVAAKCDSPTYPYSITIYGPWKRRASGDSHTSYSEVFGDAYNCHIVKAWADTR
jgi:hypothetical protein